VPPIGSISTFPLHDVMRGAQRRAGGIGNAYDSINRMVARGPFKMTINTETHLGYFARGRADTPLL
jgi:hypothetical protein